MIEHTIIKYVEKKSAIILPYTPKSTSMPAISTSHNWPKEKYASYLEDLQKRGYVIGAKVRTKYNIEGVINGFRQCPEFGIDFYASDVPNAMTIKRNNAGESSLLYSEEELTLI